MIIRSAPLWLSRLSAAVVFLAGADLPSTDRRSEHLLNRNFAFGSFFTFVVGIGMYGTTYLVPLFLAQVRGYNALQIGLTIIVVGLVTW